MSPQGHRSRARLLAPIALVTFAIAFLAVVAASGTGDGDGGSPDSDDSTAQTTSTTTKTTTASKPAAAATYTVKTGDTLGAIAQKTGVDVETLQELNPALDPQSLVSGQKIKLRE